MLEILRDILIFSSEIVTMVLHMESKIISIVLYKIKKKFFRETIYRVTRSRIWFYFFLSEEKFRKILGIKRRFRFCIIFQVQLRIFIIFLILKESKISLKYISKIIKPYKKEVICRYLLFMLLGSIITVLFFSNFNLKD